MRKVLCMARKKGLLGGRNGILDMFLRMRHHRLHLDVAQGVDVGGGMLGDLPGHVLRIGLGQGGVSDMVWLGSVWVVHEAGVVLGRVHCTRHRCSASAGGQRAARGGGSELDVEHDGGRPGERRRAGRAGRLFNDSNTSNSPIRPGSFDRLSSCARPGSAQARALQISLIYCHLVSRIYCARSSASRAGVVVRCRSGRAAAAAREQGLCPSPSIRHRTRQRSLRPPSGKCRSIAI